MNRPLPWWVVWAAGGSAGISAVAFMALPWPRGLAVVPCLAIWGSILSRLSGRHGLRTTGPVVLLVGVSALVLALLLAALLALIS